VQVAVVVVDLLATRQIKALVILVVRVVEVEQQVAEQVASQEIGTVLVLVAELRAQAVELVVQVAVVVADKVLFTAFKETQDALAVTA
jgi:hypothetical protein